MLSEYEKRLLEENFLVKKVIYIIWLWAARGHSGVAVQIIDIYLLILILAKTTNTFKSVRARKQKFADK